MPDEAIEATGVRLGDLLQQTLEEVRSVIDGRGEDLVVDLELVFKSIYVKKERGAIASLFYSQKHPQESLEVRLATRIRAS